jgi:hypothetical protein
VIGLNVTQFFPVVTIIYTRQQLVLFCALLTIIDIPTLLAKTGDRFPPPTTPLKPIDSGVWLESIIVQLSTGTKVEKLGQSQMGAKKDQRMGGEESRSRSEISFWLYDHRL